MEGLFDEGRSVYALLKQAATPTTSHVLALVLMLNVCLASSYARR